MQIYVVLQEHGGVNVAQTVEGEALVSVIIGEFPEPLAGRVLIDAGTVPAADDPSVALPGVRIVLGLHDILPHGIPEDPDHGGRQGDHPVPGVGLCFRDEGAGGRGVLQRPVHGDGAGVPVYGRILQGADFTQAQAAEHGQEDGEPQRHGRFGDDQLQEGDHFRLRKGRLLFFALLRALHPVHGVVFQQADPDGSGQAGLHAAVIVEGGFYGKRTGGRRGQGVGFGLPAGALQLFLREAGGFPFVFPEIVEPVREDGGGEIRQETVPQLREDPAVEQITVIGHGDRAGVLVQVFRQPGLRPFPEGGDGDQLAAQAGFQDLQLTFGIAALDVFRKIRIHPQRNADPLPAAADLHLGADAPGILSAVFDRAHGDFPLFQVMMKKCVCVYLKFMC